MLLFFLVILLLLHGSLLSALSVFAGIERDKCGWTREQQRRGREGADTKARGMKTLGGEGTIEKITSGT